MSTKRYWLRGGLTSLSVFIVSTIALIPFGRMHSCSFICLDFPYWSIPTLIVIYLMPPFVTKLFLSIIPYDGVAGLDFIFTAIEATLFYFIIGSIIGLIYGKTRTNSKISQ